VGDLAAADQHAEAARLVAKVHDLPLVAVFTQWYDALRLALTGQWPVAEKGYRAAASGLSGTGMAGLETGILPLAVLAARVGAVIGAERGPVDFRLAGFQLAGLELADLVDANWGAHQYWARPLLLVSQGLLSQAREALAAVPESPPDLLLEARLCLQATAALAVGDQPLMEKLYGQLLPAAGEFAGAGSGLLTLGPTASYLARLAAALDRPTEAAAHWRQAQLLVADLAQ